MVFFVTGSPIVVICVIICIILGEKIGQEAEKDPEKVGLWALAVLGGMGIVLIVLIVTLFCFTSPPAPIAELKHYQNTHVEVDASTISLGSVSVDGKIYSNDMDYVVSNINSSDNIKVVVGIPNKSSYLHSLTEEEKDKIRSRFNAAIINTENLNIQLLNQKIDYKVQIYERLNDHIKKEPEIVERVKTSLTKDQVRIWERNLYFKNRILMNDDEYFTNRNTIEELQEQFITIGKEISALQGQNYSGNLIEPMSRIGNVKSYETKTTKGYSTITYIIGGFILLLISMLSLFMAFPKKFDFPIGFSDIHKKFFKKERPKKIKRKPGIYTYTSPPKVDDNHYVTSQLLRREDLKKIINVFNKSTFSMIENIKINPSIVKIEYKKLSENLDGTCSPIVEDTYDAYGNTISSELLGYLIQIDHYSKDVADVIAHEFAHVVMFELIGNHGHDEMWQRAYEACGGTIKYWKMHNNSNYNNECDYDLIKTPKQVETNTIKQVETNTIKQVEINYHSIDEDYPSPY